MEAAVTVHISHLTHCNSLANLLIEILLIQNCISLLILTQDHLLAKPNHI